MMMLQAPLLAYTHFLEALLVHNGCREGLGHALHAWQISGLIVVSHPPFMNQCW